MKIRSDSEWAIQRSLPQQGRELGAAQAPGGVGRGRRPRRARWWRENTPFCLLLDGRSALCRSRRELSNAYLLAKFGLDTAENEPSKVCRTGRPGHELLAAGRADGYGAHRPRLVRHLGSRVRMFDSYIFTQRCGCSTRLIKPRLRYLVQS